MWLRCATKTLPGPLDWRCGHSMELHHQGVPERARPLSGQGPGAAPPLAKGYGCIEVNEAAKPLLVPKEGYSPGKFIGMPY